MTEPATVRVSAHLMGIPTSRPFCLDVAAKGALLRDDRHRRWALREAAP